MRLISLVIAMSLASGAVSCTLSPLEDLPGARGPAVGAPAGSPIGSGDGDGSGQPGRPSNGPPSGGLGGDSSDGGSSSDGSEVGGLLRGEGGSAGDDGDSLAHKTGPEDEWSGPGGHSETPKLTSGASGSPALTQDGTL